MEDFIGGESYGSGTEGLQQGQEGQESGKEKVSQADIARIEAQAKKAKQIWIKGQQIKKNNQAIANFLSFLLLNIKDEKMLMGIYGLFFTKINPNTGSKELKSTLYAVVLIGIFVPFFVNDIKNMGLWSTFEGLLQGVDRNITTSKYISYVERLCHKYKISFIEHTSQFIYFIMDILFYFGIVDSNVLEEESKKQLFKSLQKEFFVDAKHNTHHNHIHTHTHDKTK